LESIILVSGLINIATLDDLDDPLQTSSRAPLTGNISSSSRSSRPLNENYLTSRIPGEDRRAPSNTIDESVWETLRRDLLAIWSKMREVLYPKYLLGGSMLDNTTSFRGAYDHLRSTGLSGAREELAGIAGRAMDADHLLSQGNMSAGLRDWDLWGPLIFCLLLSLLLSYNAKDDQRNLVFSGVFALVWTGEAVVTMQIKLLGGNMCVVPPYHSCHALPQMFEIQNSIGFVLTFGTNRSFAQSICIIGYTLFPLVIAALLSAFRLPTIPRIPIYLVLIGWSLAAGVSILSGSGVVKNRLGLAIFPLLVFYLALGCLCFIS
jgi:hypothetical protein